MKRKIFTNRDGYNRGLQFCQGQVYSHVNSRWESLKRELKRKDSAFIFSTVHINSSIMALEDLAAKIETHAHPVSSFGSEFGPKDFTQMLRNDALAVNRAWGRSSKFNDAV